MKNDLKRCKLGDVANSQTGPFGSQLHEEDYVTEGTPIVTVEHLGPIGFTHQNLPFVSDEDTKRLSKYTLKEGDIVFSRVGSVDRSVYVKPEEEGWLFSGRCIRVRCNNAVNPRYLSFYFRLPSFKKMMLDLSVGATMPSLNTEIMDNVLLYLPSKERQDAVAQILNDIDTKIENNNAICADLEGMAKLLYDYWFVQFDFPDENRNPYKSSGGKMVWNKELKREIPEGWEATSIGDITICHDSERIPVAGKDREQMIGDIPYYGATGIMGYVDRAIFDGDYVLMAEDGSVMDDNGHPIIQRVHGKSWINNHAHVLEPKVGYTCRLLMMLLKDIPVMKIKTGSIQMKINQENMNGYKLTAIPPELRNQICKRLEPIDEMLLSIDQENRELASLRDFLLPMLMNGQVKVG